MGSAWVDDLERALDAFVAEDPSAFADNELIERLSALLSRHEAATARASAAWEASGVWCASGARGAANYLRTVTRLPKPTCRRRLRLGRGVRGLFVLEGAWLAGEVDGTHVAAVLSRCTTERLSAALRRDEATVVEWAKTRRYDVFVHDLDCWALEQDPDASDDKFRVQHEQRRFDCVKTFQGVWDLRGYLDPVSGEIFGGTFAAIERELFEADWAEAKTRLGRDPHVDELGRTPAQRRADALVEMAIRARTAPKDGRRPEPLFTVLAGIAQVEKLCELASGTVIPPGTLVPWLDQAWIERVIFGSPSRVIDVGERTRLFRGGLRRAIEVRDRECQHEFCDEPADHCQIDHIDPYEAGGVTTQTNGRLYCGPHNRARNHPPHAP